MSDDIAKQTATAQQRLRVIKVVFFGALAAIAVALAVLLFFRQAAMPDLSRARLETAQERWAGAALHDYDIAIEVVGPQTSRYEVEVRDGEAVSAMRNGTPLTQMRTWNTWSVPGMFGTVLSDVESLEAKSRALVVRCEFDARYGYPARYQRIELGGGIEVTWRVTHFEAK